MTFSITPSFLQIGRGRSAIDSAIQSFILIEEVKSTERTTMWNVECQWFRQFKCCVLFLFWFAFFVNLPLKRSCWNFLERQILWEADTRVSDSPTWWPEILWGPKSGPYVQSRIYPGGGPGAYDGGGRLTSQSCCPLTSKKKVSLIGGGPSGTSRLSGTA